MFGMFNAYKNMFLGGIVLVLVVGLYFYIHSLKSQISDLQSSLKDNQIELANSKLEANRLKTVLDQQNKKIKLLKIDTAKKTKVLIKWKELPPKIKYKTIIKIREVKSDECKDIKKQLDIIRHINFNSL